MSDVDSSKINVSNVIWLLILLMSYVVLFRAYFIGVKFKYKLSMLFYVLYMLSLVLSSLFCVFGSILAIFRIINYNKNINIIQVGLIGCGGLFLYLFSLQIYFKLIYAFKGTLYAISSFKKKLFVINLIIGLISLLLCIIFIPISLEFGSLFAMPAIVIYNFISILMIYIFIKNLLSLITNSIEKNNESKMIHSIVKYILTSLIGYTSTIILLTLDTILIQFTNDILLVGILFILNGFINLCVFYLQYSFTSNDYNIFCNKCHQCILLCVNNNRIKMEQINDNIYP